MESDISTKINNHFSKYPKRTYTKGQILVFAGENPDYIFFITKGRVRQYDVSYRGDEVIVNVFKPNAFFPMSWAINKTKNRYFFKTEIETELHVIPAHDAMEFIKSNPDVMIDLLSRLYKGMDGLLGRVVHLMSGTAKSRLLYELIIECRRNGEVQKDGSILLGLKENDIAARSGLSRETVSRLLTRLKESAIQVTSHGIIITDLAELEKIHGPEI